MDAYQFKLSRERIINDGRTRKGIGTLGEKTLHAVLKSYFGATETDQEVKIGSYVADILGENGIIEIQTRSFDKLRKKLNSFLTVSPVTVVYPIASTKWLIWIDEKTGEATLKRKSPKKGSRFEVFFELYKIKQYLIHPLFKLCIVLLDMEEYRCLNGWSKDKKKGSSRFERIPVDIIEEIDILSVSDYEKLLPQELPQKFTSADFKKASGLSMRNSQTALNILSFVGTVRRVGKTGNRYLYEKHPEKI